MRAAAGPFSSLYVQVLVAIALGVLLGHFFPAAGEAMKPLGDGFIKLIKMLIAPIIFCTVVLGIAGMEDMKKVGKTGGLALLYFEVVSSIALVVGLVVVNVVRPGAGMNVDPATLDAKAVAQYATAGEEQSVSSFLLNIIPDTVFGAFARGEILQVLLVAVLFGFALHALGRESMLFRVVEQASQVLFRIVGFIMRVAPIGAFGAMAFTIGKYGVDSLASLGKLMACFYATCLIFIFLVLGRHRAPARLSHHALRPLHPGGAVHRARHVVIGIGAAADDRAHGECGRAEVGGGARDPDRLFLQPGWHFDLSHHGGGVRGAGDQHAVELRRPDAVAGRAAAHVQGRGWRDGAAASSCWRQRSRRWAMCRSRRWR